MLRFENYFEGDVTFAGDLPVTSKADGRNHGFGTRNMRRVADTWSGSLTMEAEDGWFVVRALLPVPTTTVAGAVRRTEAVALRLARACMREARRRSEMS